MKKKKHPISFLAILYFSIFFNVENQLYAQSYKDYVPPTPTAAALAKYVDQPVSLYTGTPEINIPIYEVKSGSLSLPISLNYHAGGFKVEEEATWAGLGWSVLAGGSITRSIRNGLDNTFRDSFFNTYQGGIIDPNSPSGYNELSFLANGGLTDGIPDIYSFNFNGLSGKFIDVNGIQLLPKQPLAIYKDQNGNYISVTDAKGNTYFFSDLEKSRYKDAATSTLSTTSWFLTWIISPQEDTIKFEYKDTYFVQNMSISESKVYSTNATHFSLDSYNLSSATTYLEGKELSKIKFCQGEIEFVSDYNREDIDNAGGSHQGGLRLNKIIVKNKIGETIKHFSLNYSYFHSYPGSIDYYTKRLKLLSLQEESSAGEAIHKFYYEENINLPVKNSKSQDHWGYFNNKNNSSLVPDLINGNNGCIASSYYLGDNRETDTASVKANILTKIIYPTGGYAKFKYEANDYGFIGSHALPIEIKRINQVFPRSVVSAYSPGHAQDIDSIFFINKTQCVKISISLQQAQTFTGKDFLYCALYDGSSNLVRKFILKGFNNNESYEEFIELTPGAYYLEAKAIANGAYAIATLQYELFDEVNSQIKYAGGIRVKTIVQHSGIGPDIIKNYSYNFNEDGNRSSGVLISKPEYEQNIYGFKKVQDENGSGTSMPCEYIQYNQLLISSSCINAPGSGFHIGYREVCVKSGSLQDHGKSISKFTSSFNYPTLGANSEFGSPVGRLLIQKDFKNDGTLVQKIENQYDTKPGPAIYGLLVNIVAAHPCSQDTYNDVAYYVYPRFFYQSPAYFQSDFHYLNKDIRTQYNGHDSITTITNYYYDNIAHLQPTRVITSTSSSSSASNEVKVTATSYPADYADTNGFIADLNANHIIVPIEQVEYKQDAGGNNQKILKGTVITYKSGPFNKGLKDQVWKLETNAPVNLSTFKFSGRSLGVLPNSGTPALFLKDSRYKKNLVFDNYDQQNRLVQLTKTNDQPVAMIWSKDGENLLAQATNARANQIFYTSFEEDGTVVSQAKTGERAHTGNYTIPSGKEPVMGTYVLSYWEKQNGQWKYQEQQVNYQPGAGPLINSANEIDEVRLYPPGASMITYSYKPLVGNTSVCDQNNQVIYYFYDGAGRLSHIRDDKGNMLQKYEYKYVNQ